MPLVTWSVGLLLSTVAPEPVVDVDAEVRAAELANEEGRHADASAGFARVYAETGDTRYLYAQATVEREGGRCGLALPLYEEFIAKEPHEDTVGAVLALGFVQRCRDELGLDEPRPSPPLPALGELNEPSPSFPPPAPPRPWYRDPWGGALVGLGLAGAAAGGVLVGVGFRRADAASNASDDRAFGDEIDDAQTLSTAGGAVLGVGGALLIGGVVRWIVVARSTERVTVVPGSRGLVLGGRLPSLHTMIRRW